MSTDLQILNLQTLNSPSIHTYTPDEQSSNSNLQPSRTDNHHGDGNGSSGESCLTPTSEKHRIPAVLRCPPAPKKPRFSRSSSCKRKLSELDFFDIVNHREVDAFFELASAAAATATGVSKRRRPLIE